MNEPRNRHRLVVGQRVVVLDAYGELRKASVAAIPRDARDRHGSPTYTTRGAFPKVWITIEGKSGSVPWPAEDVFTDPDAAKAKQAAHPGSRDGSDV